MENKEGWFIKTEMKEQLIKRLIYLWDLADKNPEQYMAKRLGEEKEEIYSACGCDDTVGLAQKIYYGTHDKAFQAIVKEGSEYRYDLSKNTVLGR